jgi:hypothetical protein
MTYGWMLLVVAIVGGLIFALASDQGLGEESIRGFDSNDLEISEVSTSDQGVNLQVAGRSPDEIEIKETCLFNSNFEVSRVCTDELETLNLGTEEIVQLSQFNESEESHTYDVTLTYDKAGFEDLTAEGEVTVNAKPLERISIVNAGPLFDEAEVNEEKQFFLKYQGVKGQAEIEASVQGQKDKNHSWTFEESSGTIFFDFSFQSPGNYNIKIQATDTQSKITVSETINFDVEENSVDSSFNIDRVETDEPLEKGSNIQAQASINIPDDISGVDVSFTAEGDNITQPTSTTNAPSTIPLNYNVLNITEDNKIELELEVIGGTPIPFEKAFDDNSIDLGIELVNNTTSKVIDNSSQSLSILSESVQGLSINHSIEKLASEPLERDDQFEVKFDIKNSKESSESLENQAYLREESIFDQQESIESGSEIQKTETFTVEDLDVESGGYKIVVSDSNGNSYNISSNSAQITVETETRNSETGGIYEKNAKNIIFDVPEDSEPVNHLNAVGADANLFMQIEPYQILYDDSVKALGNQMLPRPAVPSTDLNAPIEGNYSEYENLRQNITGIVNQQLEKNYNQRTPIELQLEDLGTVTFYNEEGTGTISNSGDLFGLNAINEMLSGDYSSGAEAFRENQLGVIADFNIYEDEINDLIDFYKSQSNSQVPVEKNETGEYTVYTISQQEDAPANETVSIAILTEGLTIHNTLAIGTTQRVNDIISNLEDPQSTYEVRNVKEGYEPRLRIENRNLSLGNQTEDLILQQIGLINQTINDSVEEYNLNIETQTLQEGIELNSVSTSISSDQSSNLLSEVYLDIETDMNSQQTQKLARIFLDIYSGNLNISQQQSLELESLEEIEVNSKGDFELGFRLEAGPEVYDQFINETAPIFAN